MTVNCDDHERTIIFADMALRQIRSLRQPAFPRNYEVWYTYATGHNPSLNQSINETLKRHGTLNDTDIDHIYQHYLAPTRLSDRIDEVNVQLLEEIEQVVGLIESATGNANDYSENLASIREKIGGAKDGDGLRNLVETLVRTTKEMERNNHRLEERLSNSKQEINQLQKNLESARSESMTDPLTSLANRKFFDQTLEKSFAEARNCDAPLSLLMADIDNFKAFNDNYGHLTGDQVLRLVALALKQNVKGQDTAARYGGEEFAIILPGTMLRSAVTVADHIRRAVMTKELMKRSTGERLGRVTVSIGVATLRAGDTAQSLIERADSCLYAAKRNGRNQVICESDPQASQIAAAQVA